MTYYQQLIQHLENVKEILTEETWDKNTYYFSVKNNTLSMSVDGAIQTQVNPQLKKVYKEYLNKEITAARVYTTRAARESSRSAARNTKDFSDLFDLWINREGWIKEDCIINNINYGNLDLHYLIGLTGLDYKFERKPEITLSIVKNKLDETIKLIKKIERYIAYV